MQGCSFLFHSASWVSTVGKVDCVIPASGVLHTFCLLKDSMVEWEAVGIHWGKCKLPKHYQRSRRGRQGSVSVEYKIWGVGWQEWLPRSQKKVMPSSSNKCVTKAKLEDISSPTSEKHEIRVCYAFASFAFFDFKSGSWFSGGDSLFCFCSSLQNTNARKWNHGMRGWIHYEKWGLHGSSTSLLCDAPWTQGYGRALVFSSVKSSLTVAWTNVLLALAQWGWDKQ